MNAAALAWAGTALYLTNHAVFSVWPGYPRPAYLAFNLLAALLVLAGSAMMASWQPVAVNVFWAAISAWGLVSRSAPALRVPGRFLAWPVAGLLALSVLLVPVLPRIAFELAGWLSVLAFAGSYLLFTGRAISRHAFLAYNVLAALALLPILSLTGNWPVFALEVAWAGLSFYALIRERRGVASAPLEPKEDA